MISNFYLIAFLMFPGLNIDYRCVDLAIVSTDCNKQPCWTKYETVIVYKIKHLESPFVSVRAMIDFHWVRQWANMAVSMSIYCIFFLNSLQEGCGIFCIYLWLNDHIYHYHKKKILYWIFPFLFSQDVVACCFLMLVYIKRGSPPQCQFGPKETKYRSFNPLSCSYNTLTDAVCKGLFEVALFLFWKHASLLCDHSVEFPEGLGRHGLGTEWQCSDSATRSGL